MLSTQHTLTSPQLDDDFSYDALFGSDSDESLKHDTESFDDDSSDHLIDSFTQTSITDCDIPRSKYSPIQTTRTVQEIAASAPQLRENFVHASLSRVMSNKKPHQEEKRDTSHPSLQREQPYDSDCLKDCSPNMPPYHKVRSSTATCLNETNDLIGSVPIGNMLHNIKSKREDYTDTSLEGKYGKYVTISTLSFNHYLSPDTPLLTIGNRNADTKLLISVGIHGDEPCGILGFNELLAEGFFNNLSPSLMITALVGNPAAVEKNQRFVEFNLNRMIREDLFSQKSYESERARVVSKAINNCDVMLDLHSCSAKAPAHALPMDEPKSIELASKLPVGYVIKYLAHSTKGKATTLDWAKQKGKIGVCVECGQHEERQTIENAKNCIKTFVQIYSKQPVTCSPSAIILNSRENESVRKGFKFVRNVKAFERVPCGEVIARDDIVGEIRSKYKNGTFIVMPTRKPVLGEEAWFYAELSESLYD